MSCRRPSSLLLRRPLPARRDTLTTAALDGHHRRVAWRSRKETPITRDEVTHLILMIMRIDWKLNLILEELEIDHGEAAED